MLNIRDLKRTTSSIQHCGWGGIIFEGEPGTGKSEFVMAALRQHKFIELTSFKILPTTEKIYYHLDANLAFEKKVEVLQAAFHAGAIVIIDEINSCLLPERLLNSLLMGCDLENRAPKNPGFMLIGTQNSIGMEGRKSLSPALQQRLMKAEFTPYNYKEVIIILTKEYKAPINLAEVIAKDYFAARQFAIQHYKSPIPTFTTVVLCYQQMLKSNIINPLDRQLVIKENKYFSDTFLGKPNNTNNQFKKSISKLSDQPINITNTTHLEFKSNEGNDSDGGSENTSSSPRFGSGSDDDE